MTKPEFDKAHVIRRGKFALDVVTNVVRLPDGKLVSLSELEALTFAVVNPQHAYVPPKILADRATDILSELSKNGKCPSISAGEISNAVQNLKCRKLPDWPGYFKAKL